MIDCNEMFVNTLLIISLCRLCQGDASPNQTQALDTDWNGGYRDTFASPRNDSKNKFDDIFLTAIIAVPSVVVISICICCCVAAGIYVCCYRRRSLRNHFAIDNASLLNPQDDNRDGDGDGDTSENDSERRVINPDQVMESFGANRSGSSTIETFSDLEESMVTSGGISDPPRPTTTSGYVSGLDRPRRPRGPLGIRSPHERRRYSKLSFSQKQAKLCLSIQKFNSQCQSIRQKVIQNLEQISFNLEVATGYYLFPGNHVPPDLDFSRLWSKFDIDLMKELCSFENMKTLCKGKLYASFLEVKSAYEEIWDYFYSLNEFETGIITHGSTPHPSFQPLDLRFSHSEQMDLPSVIKIKEYLCRALEIPLHAVLLLGYRKGSVIINFLVSDRISKDIKKKALNIFREFEEDQDLECRWMHAQLSPQYRIEIYIEESVEGLEKAAFAARQIKMADLNFKVFVQKPLTDMELSSSSGQYSGDSISTSLGAPLQNNSAKPHMKPATETNFPRHEISLDSIFADVIDYTNDITPKWRQLAESLNIWDCTKLQTQLQKDPSEEQKCLTVLLYWAVEGASTTVQERMEKLVRALQKPDVNLKDIAKKLEELL